MVRRLLLVILLGGLHLHPGLAGAQEAPPNWVASFSELRPAPLDLNDRLAPLEQRIALARALGEHGPAGPAVASLGAALQAEPPAPSLLREALALALARRQGEKAPAPEPIERVLEAARARQAKAPADQSTRRLGKAWLERPRSGAVMVQAFLREPDPTTLRAMVGKLAELHLLGLVPPSDPYVLSQALCDARTAPHAILMLAADARRAPSETTRRLLRAALAGVPCASSVPYAADDDPTVVPIRIVAALGLAAIDDAAAVAPLRHALRSPYARVRLAAAVALSKLATPTACAALAAQARIEPSASVRRALGCHARSRA